MDEMERDTEIRKDFGSPLAVRLMNAIGSNIYEAGNFIVCDAMQQGLPITFVSDGFCTLTGDK